MSWTCLRPLALALLFALPAAQAWSQIVIQGPYYFGGASRYYLITNGNYEQFRAKARSMGGDLATIDDAAENAQLASVFANSKPFIGLNDAAVEGTLVWSDGSSSTFRNWLPGQPNNSASRDFARILNAAGQWDLVSATDSNAALVEINHARPIHVPSELPSLEQGAQAADDTGASAVQLAPGEYSTNTLVQIDDFELRGSGVAATIIRGAALRLDGSALVRDVTITRRSFFDTITVEATRARFQRVKFVTQVYGPGVYVFFTGPGVASFDRCTFTGGGHPVQAMGKEVFMTNSVLHDLHGVLQSSNADFTATNCTFARIGDGTTYVIENDGQTLLTNSILINSNEIPPNVSVLHSLSERFFPGTGNRVGDPLFVDAAGNDFSLLPQSPAIDAGSVQHYLDGRPLDLQDFAGNTRSVDAPAADDAIPGSSPIDIGAFEFQPPTAQDTCRPDFNNDGFVDDFDFVLFAQAYDLFTCP